MSTAADSTAYGGGAGGKFRKRPFRRPQPTPYDRPLTALRKTWRNNDNNSNGGSGGWLSRIVDPASKLISAGAHKLFSSVFRKRLLPPPPQPSPDEKVGRTENHLGDAITENPSRLQERDRNEVNTQNSGSGTDGVAELEYILKQKTFTRSEIDRLTVLLHSRTVDKTGIAGQRRFESTHSESPAGHSRQEELDGTACENGVNPTDVPGVDFTPDVRSKVNDDDVASPAELAKAYMGSRSTSVSPSMLGLRSQAVREETHAFTKLQLHRPSISTMQKPLSTAGTSQNDFVVPRSRGRTAIYSMARTPYSRVPPTATKGLGTSSNAFDERYVLSSQKALKRRCSVLENDIGAVGPIRRIRQKSNLLHSKNLGPPSSRTPLTNVTPSEVGEVPLHSSSKSHEDRGDMGVPVSSSQISSKSMEMGQRILQQLEKMTPLKEKSSEKKPGFSAGMSAMELTPAMLHGKARKSLETANSLKYLQSDQVCGKKVDSLDVASHDVQDSTPKKQDKVYDISSNVTVNSSNKVFPEKNEARNTDNDIMDITKNTAPVVLKSAVDVPKKSRAFQMSAYEEYLELDDDVHSNGVASPVINEGKRNLEPSSMQSNGTMLQENQAKTTEANTPPDFPELKSSSNLVLKNIAVDSSTLAEKDIGHSFPADSVSNKRIGSSAPSLQAVTTSTSDKADNPASTTISFGLKSSDKVSPASFFLSSAVESSIPKAVKSHCPSSVFAFAAGATEAAIKSPGSTNKSTEAVDLFKKSDNTSPSSFSGTFGQSTFTASTGSTGVSATEVDGDAADTATATTASVSGSGNSLTSSVAFPSIQPGLKFGGSSMASSSAVMPASVTDTAGRSKETAFGNSTSSSLSGSASAAAPSSTIATFQFGASTITASASTTESMPGQSCGLALPAPSGSSSLPVKSEVNQFGPLTSASPFSSSSTFESSSSGSLSMAASGSASSASTNIFGSSSQPSNLPVFGSAFSNSSSGPSFGASSASTPSSNASSGFAFETTSISAPANVSTAGVNFGTSSTSAAADSNSSSSGFSFGAFSASSTPISSLSPGFAFGTTSTSAPANGSTAGAPFGASPASAAAGSTSSVLAFGSTSSASSSTPLPSFSFGAPSASASSGGPSSTFSFGAPSASASSSATSSSTFSFGASSASAASSAAPSSTFLFGASSAAASSAAPSSTFLFGASSASASSSAPSSSFSFGASSASSGAPSSTLSFGASSASASSSAPSPTFSFGASPASATTASGSIFSFGSSASAPAPTAVQTSQPAFGNGGSVFSFGSAPSPSHPGNNDQMTMEDSMAEDSMQSSAATTPVSVFGQSPTSNFAFGMAPAPAPAPALAPAPSGANPFQFGGQQSQVAAPQNPFQNSGSFDGGSFSLGAGGNDKSNRRIVKIRNRNRKK